VAVGTVNFVQSFSFGQILPQPDFGALVEVIIFGSLVILIAGRHESKGSQKN
jgi:hypothetical protein